jgi:hypothetical protein
MEQPYQQPQLAPDQEYAQLPLQPPFFQLSLALARANLLINNLDLRINPRMAVEPFPDYDKFKINTAIAQSIDRRQQGAIIVLDGEQIGTSTILCGHGGFDPQSVFIPNYGNAQNIKAKATRLNLNLNVANISLHRMIELCPFFTVSALFADYCCTFKGNKRCSPKEDLNLAFQKHIFMPGAVLAVTICYARGGSKEDIHALDEFVSNQAASHGFNATKKRIQNNASKFNREEYRGALCARSMATLLWIITICEVGPSVGREESV